MYIEWKQLYTYIKSGIQFGAIVRQFRTHCFQWGVRRICLRILRKKLVLLFFSTAIYSETTFYLNLWWWVNHLGDLTWNDPYEVLVRYIYDKTLTFRKQSATRSFIFLLLKTIFCSYHIQNLAISKVTFLNLAYFYNLIKFLKRCIPIFIWQPYVVIFHTRTITYYP